MIRRSYAKHQVLLLYRKLERVIFPIRPEELIEKLDSPTKLMSFSSASIAAKCSVPEIIAACGSRSGATQYDRGSKRFLILFNETEPFGRKLWTQCHEIGHICLGHFPITNTDIRTAENTSDLHGDLEREADFFTWNLISPLPAMLEFDIGNAKELSHYFGLTNQASEIQFERFSRWKARGRFSSWDREILNTIRKTTLC